MQEEGRTACRRNVQQERSDKAAEGTRNRSPDEGAWKGAEQAARLAQRQAAEASRAAGERKKELETREEQLCRQAQALLPALRQAALPGAEELSAAETERNTALSTAVQREREANGRAEQAKLLGGTIPDRKSVV